MQNKSKHPEFIGCDFKKDLKIDSTCYGLVYQLNFYLFDIKGQIVCVDLFMNFDTEQIGHIIVAVSSLPLPNPPTVSNSIKKAAFNKL